MVVAAKEMHAMVQVDHAMQQFSGPGLDTPTRGNEFEVLMPFRLGYL